MLAVDVEHTDDFLTFIYRNYNFASRLAAASDVARELLYVFHHDGAALFPRRAADALAISNAGTGHGTLEGTEHQLLADDAVEARPPEMESFMNQGGHIGHVGDRVGLILHHRFNLGEEEFVGLLFVHFLYFCNALQKYKK